MRRAGTGRTRGRAAYPLMVLLVPLLVAGCADGGPPVPRPSLPTGTQVATPTGAGPSRSPGPTARSDTVGADSRHVFPVRSRDAAYHPTHSAYPATDIFAACGVEVVAVTDGRILEVSRVDRFDEQGPRGPFNGGQFVSLLGDDGVRYYGSHLSAVATGIEAGVRVRAGQRVGAVGRTGNANNVCHLHFGISPPCSGADGWWIRRGVIWPAPYLDAWRKQSNKSPAGTVRSWLRTHGCPKAP